MLCDRLYTTYIVAVTDRRAAPLVQLIGEQPPWARLHSAAWLGEVTDRLIRFDSRQVLSEYSLRCQV